ILPAGTCAGSHDPLLINPRRLCMFGGEEVGVACANEIKRISNSVTLSLGAAHAHKAALFVFEIDAVGNFVEQGVEKFANVLSRNIRFSLRSILVGWVHLLRSNWI